MKIDDRVEAVPTLRNMMCGILMVLTRALEDLWARFTSLSS
jgi:hypothetical protein